MDKHHHASGSAFDDLTDQIGQMMEEMKNRPFFRFSAGRGWQPAINLYEVDAAYVVCMALAGMKGDNIDVHVAMRTVIISGKRPQPHPSGEALESIAQSLAGGSVHLMEIETGSFRREVETPTDVDVRGVSTTYENGYLWVLLPKTDSMPSDRQVS